MWNFFSTIHFLDDLFLGVPHKVICMSYVADCIWLLPLPRYKGVNMGQTPNIFYYYLAFNFHVCFSFDFLWHLLPVFFKNSWPISHTFWDKGGQRKPAPKLITLFYVKPILNVVIFHSIPLKQLFYWFATDFDITLAVSTLWRDHRIKVWICISNLILARLVLNPAMCKHIWSSSCGFRE